MLRGIEKNGELPTSAGAAKAEAKAKARKEWGEEWERSKRRNRMKEIGELDELLKFGIRTKKLKRHEISAVVQIRTGHIPLNQYLHRIGKAETATCSCGRGAETPKHYVMECPNYRHERHDMRLELRHKARDWKYICGTEKGMKELAKYIGRTERLKGLVVKQTPE
ncbi:FMN adenylyltransferase [Coprinopsis cinerea AmutBmut pab1-1]|nr:FMN adenylyltransferase [Coprinopsis cinerea AmutBmut pab1-1]